jgi:hypothetical protein
MLARSLCALLLLASPAAALDIYEDLTLTEGNYPGGPIKVYGSASLTIAGNPITARIELYDNASLDVQGGDIRGAIEVHGANHVRQTAGEITRIDVLTREATSYELLGGYFGTTLQGAFAGDHRVTIDFDRYTSAPDRIGAPGMFVQAYASEPFVRTGPGGLPVIGSLVSAGEFEAFSQVVMGEWLLSVPGGVLGDATRDGLVDLDDLNAVRNNFGRTDAGSLLDGDAMPYDGRVDLDDLNRVRNAFGNSHPVPEPATLALMALACPLLLTWRRSNRGRLRR